MGARGLGSAEAGHGDIVQQPLVGADHVGAGGLRQSDNAALRIEFVDFDVQGDGAVTNVADAHQARPAPGPVLVVLNGGVRQRVRAQARGAAFEVGNQVLLDRSHRNDDDAEEHEQWPGQLAGTHSARAHGRDFRLVGQRAQPDHGAEQAGDGQHIDADARQ